MHRLSLIVLLAPILLAASTPGSIAQTPDFLAFESGPVRPVATSPTGHRVFAVNTPDNALEIFDVVAGGELRHRASVPVGLEPVAVAARTHREAWVVNHLSDSVSIVDTGANPPRVVRTLLVGDEPRDVVFAKPTTYLASADAFLGGRLAFVTTAHRGRHREHPSLNGVPGAGDPRLTDPGVPRADVWVFEAQDLGDGLGGTPRAILELFGDTPRALAVDREGERVYAAVFNSGNRTTTVHEEIVCDGFSPSDVEDACPGEFPGSPGGNPGPSTNHQGARAPEVGLIVQQDASGLWRDELGRDWSHGIRFGLPDLDVFRIDADSLQVDRTWSGVGTTLFNLAVDPSNPDLVYVSNTEAKNLTRFEGPGVHGGSTVQGNLARSRITVLEGEQVRPRHLNSHLDYDRRPASALDQASSLATPLGMALSADGKTLYAAAFGSAKVGVYSTASLRSGNLNPRQAANAHLDVSGGGPSGVALDERRARLYVTTRFDNGISVFNLRTGREIQHLTFHNPEPKSVVDGRPFLYDAVFSSSNGEASCASCHIFGDLDGLAWDLGDPDADVGRSPMEVVLAEAAFLFSPPVNGSGDIRDFHPMKGPMTTQTLRGMSHSGPMHWRGDRADGHFGRGLDEDLSFRNFIVAFEGLLGRDGLPSNAQMQAFSDFVLQIVLPPNPVRALDNRLNPRERAGRDLYLGPRRMDGGPAPLPGNTCNDCHTLAPARGHFGTDGRQSFEAETQIVKIPHLRNMYQKVGMFGMPDVEFVNEGDNEHLGDQVRGFGFLHDGSIDTMGRFFDAEVFNEAGPVGFQSDEERRDMVDFMLAFDTDLAPIVGQQITLDAAIEERLGTVVRERIALLAERAASPFVSRILGGNTVECDLIAQGTIDGEARGFLYRPDGDVFQGDREAEAATPREALLDLTATEGNVLTFTCVPPGSGVRTALDRDRDEAWNGDEIDAGSDPADASSVPGPAPDIEVDPLVRNFGDVVSGTTAAARKVTVTSDGAEPLRVGRIAVRGTNRDQYAIIEDGCSEKTLAPGVSCRVRVVMTPTAQGLQRALLVIPSDDPNEGEVIVALRGTGTSG